MRMHPVLILLALSIVLLACLCPLTQWITPEAGIVNETPLQNLSRQPEADPSLPPSLTPTPDPSPTCTTAVEISPTNTRTPTQFPFDFTDAEDVWIYRADNARTGRYSGTGPVAAPEIAWSFQTEGPIHAAPVLVGGVAYFGSDDGRFYAVDIQLDQTLWSFQTGGTVRTSPALVDRTLFFGSDDGSLYALDAASGEPIWSFATGGSVASSPALDEGRVFFGSDDGFLYALDAATGELAWQFEVEGVVDDETGIHKSIRSSPALANSTVLVSSAQIGGASAELFFYSLDSLTGAKRWEVQGMNRITTAALWQGTAYYGGVGVFSGLDILTGSLVFSHSTEIVAAEPAIAGNTILYTTEDGRLVALDAQTGGEIWVHETGSWFLNAPSAADGAVYLTSGDGFVASVDLTSGESLWQIDTGVGITTAPVIYGGLVFVGCEDGRLLALQ